MHPDPVIPLADSLFEPEDPAPDPTLTAPDWVNALGGDYLYAHVASPDAHIDEPNRRIVMYYHGLLRDPALFTDNGQVYMAYCGGAESGLGIARVDGL